MVALCATLTVLQYRWTGELARAELGRLAESLRQQAELMAGSFDVELTENCTALVPTVEEMRILGRQQAYEARWQKWHSSNPRPIFRRVGVAVYQGGGTQLYRLDPKTVQMEPWRWPPEWMGIEDNVLRRRREPGRPPPFVGWAAPIYEFPIMEQPPQRGMPPEGERLIVELNMAYVRETWLPDLTRRFLNSEDQSVAVEVRGGGGPSELIYASQSVSAERRESVANVRFNRILRTGNVPRDNGRWTLQAWRYPGAWEGLVASSRKRNMAVAGLINALILAAGVLLLRYTRRSRELSEAQMNFVASVSHELRTPLTVIRGAAHNLQRGVVHDRAKVEQYAGLIGQHADALNAMVEQVLQFAAAKKSIAVTQKVPVSLPEMIQQAITSAATETEAAHCEVQVELTGSLPLLEGDATALERAFANLIGNAAKHGGKGGRIEIKGRAVNGNESRAVQIEVSDQGPGIPADELEKVFIPFFRGNAAQEKQTRGSGLGLSLVREIIEAHGGTVTATNRESGGATFVVRLPYRP